MGHIGGCLSVVELLTVLYFEAMNIDPKDPKMPGRDRFICSKGHAGPAVYAALANRGFFDKSMLLTLNQGGTNLPSHCDMNRTPGIDMTTGSLGQGFSCAVGAALGAKLARDGATIYTLIGDGESQEGQIWEAAMFAAAKKLDNLIAFTDYNKLQIDGTVAEVNDVAPLAEKWAAFGWNVIEVEDGNDVEQVSAAVAHAKLGQPRQRKAHHGDLEHGERLRRPVDRGPGRRQPQLQRDRGAGRGCDPRDQRGGLIHGNESCLRRVPC